MGCGIAHSRCLPRGAVSGGRGRRHRRGCVGKSTFQPVVRVVRFQIAVPISPKRATSEWAVRTGSSQTCTKPYKTSRSCSTTDANLGTLTDSRGTSREAEKGRSRFAQTDSARPLETLPQSRFRSGPLSVPGDHEPVRPETASLEARRRKQRESAPFELGPELPTELAARCPTKSVESTESRHVRASERTEAKMMRAEPWSSAGGARWASTPSRSIGCLSSMRAHTPERRQARRSRTPNIEH